MGKKLKKVLAFCLALNVSISTMGMTALAAETTTETETITNSNGTTTEKITTTTPETDPETGEVTMVIEIKEITSGTEKGMQENAPALTVDVPMTTVDDPETEEVDNTNTVEGAPVGTTTVTGNTTSTVVSQGSVTVNTEEITVTETVKTGDTDLSHVSSETAPSETNDLIKENQTAAPEQFLPGNEDATPAEGEGTPTGNETPTEDDNYQFEYAGTGNTSQFRPAVVFTEPLTDEQKVEQYGDHYYNGAYIVKDYYTTHFVNQLDPAYRDTIAKNEDGTYKTDDAGYLLDKDVNRVLKNERTMVGPDGKIYYLHSFDNNGSGNYVEGWYQDGEWVEELNAPAKVDANGTPIALEEVQLLDKNGDPVLDNDGKPVYVKVDYLYVTSGGKYVRDEEGNILTSYGAVWAGAQQFVLVDKETGEVITTYCADITTRTEMGFGYNIVNLEDSTYYSDEQAAQIRAIATSGYWGTVGYETDADGNPVYKTDADGKVITDDAGNPIPVPQTGSLDAMKEMLRSAVDKDGNRIFSDDDLASLTDGVALTATQMAIWSCSNHMAGTEFVNTHYFGEPDQVATDGIGVGGNVPMDKEDEAELMFRVYEYLKSLAPISYEGKETTANTIINADNFLEEMSVTVVEKAVDHVNNRDNDDTNDAYVTNLTFALVVTPSTENGDDLIVKVLDAKGNELASGRIAGEAKEGENVLTADEEGNYSFTGITLTEGNQNFNITLEGIQHLEQGVYLYTSEVREDVSSQTMVGIAEGNREVDVSMNICFEFSVEDEIVATERVWREERTSTEVIIPDEEPPLSDVPIEEPVDPPTEPEQAPDEPVVEIPNETPPLADIPNEDIPLANVPKTGDTSALWLALSALFGSCLIGLTILDRKRNEG